MRRFLAAVAGLAIVATGAFIATGDASSPSAAPAGAVRFPAGFTTPIYVGDVQAWPTTVPAGSSSTSSSRPSTTTSPPAPSSTSAPTTSSVAPTTSTTVNMPSTGPSTTATPSSGCGTSGVVFCEDFSDPNQFRRDNNIGWSGELHAGALFGADQNGWAGDHDGMCADPNNTHRTVTIGGASNAMGEDDPAAAAQAFYSCLPGGDPTKGHVMTSVDTEGYVIAWWSPKQIFSDVREVCWEQSEQNNGGGTWTQVVFLTPTEYQGKTDLGFTNPTFNHDGFPGLPNGNARFGVMDKQGTLQAWAEKQFTPQTVVAGQTTSHAPRFQRCVLDNEDGTLTLTAVRPDATVATARVSGQIPNGPIRVVFEHDAYNVDKHFSTDVERGLAPVPPFIYTWHWDRPTIRAAKVAPS